MKTPYTDHGGTIRVSGHSDCVRIGKCAAHYSLNGREPVDFLFIGANAAHIAAKSMCCFSELIEEGSGGATTVRYEALHVTVNTHESDGTLKEKDATVFRAHLIRKAA